MLPTIVGQVDYVSVTGAFAVIDGWHIPCAEICGIGRPTIADQDRYDNAMRRLRGRR